MKQCCCFHHGEADWVGLIALYLHLQCIELQQKLQTQIFKCIWYNKAA